MQYSHLVLHCAGCWPSRGQVNRRFWIQRNIAHDFLEEKDELPEEKASFVIKNGCLM